MPPGGRSVALSRRMPLAGGLHGPAHRPARNGLYVRTNGIGHSSRDWSALDGAAQLVPERNYHPDDDECDGAECAEVPPGRAVDQHVTGAPPASRRRMPAGSCRRRATWSRKVVGTSYNRPPLVHRAGRGTSHRSRSGPPTSSDARRLLAALDNPTFLVDGQVGRGYHAVEKQTRGGVAAADGPVGEGTVRCNASGGPHPPRRGRARRRAGVHARDARQHDV